MFCPERKFALWLGMVFGFVDTGVGVEAEVFGAMAGAAEGLAAGAERALGGGFAPDAEVPGFEAGAALAAWPGRIVRGTRRPAHAKPWGNLRGKRPGCRPPSR